MSQIAMVTVEGVLAGGEDLRAAPPQKWAKPLYDAVRSQFRTVALTSAEQDVARWWLRREGLDGWSSILSWNHVTNYEIWRIEQVREFLANAWEIAFLLDIDRDVTTVAQSMGVLTLGIGPPLHHPGWQPEHREIRMWTDLQSTVDPRP